VAERARILVSAYACEPGRGSDPSIGWNIVTEMAEHHDVWVITRQNNRGPIAEALARSGGGPSPRFEYFDLPPHLSFYKRGGRGVGVYYYRWQLGAARFARELHRRHRFDLAHHVTFVRYWSPTAVDDLGIPFVIGPVGGGEWAPASTWGGAGATGYFYESARTLARWVADRDPNVLRSLRRADTVIAATDDTRDRLVRLGCGRVVVEGVAGLSCEEIASAGDGAAPGGPLTFASVGRLLHWKGFHLGLRAFARLPDRTARYSIVGTGPMRSRLERLARDLGVAERVRFLGHRPRSETLELIRQSHVLVHPSLHDSGGFVCLEAMAAGRPVVCLDRGGPAAMVHDGCAITVPSVGVEQVVADPTLALERLARDPALRERMGREARSWVSDHHAWPRKGARIREVYRAALERGV
jgi:glycosyltransferase involved in cell wall biosynthesis